ncbi:MAG: ABC transporter permease [Candidatus Omnitrophica bacterium]|nr:ABC transporter permease [Candidatus Omnitrophota bacterium]
MNLVSSLRELWSYRRLVKQLAVRDLKARYKVSVLGFFWSLLRPLLTIAVLAVVFSSLLDLQSGSYDVPYYILLLVTYMPWFYFSTALLEGVHSLLSNANLIQKVYSPRTVFPAAVVSANLVNFLFSLVVVIPIIYLLSGAHLSWTILHLPFVIAVHTAFLFGLCLMTSVLNVLYRDTTQIMEFLVFVWFYLSPVLYDVSEVFKKVPDPLQFSLFFLNPMAGILEWYRYAILSSNMRLTANAPVDLEIQRSIVFSAGIPFAILASIVVFIVGFKMHKKLETRAVDAL